MKNPYRYIKGGGYRIRLFVFLVALLFVTGARGDDIIENEVEDINVLISQVIGGQPNVLIVYDNSLSMGDNFGGAQLGSWDFDSVISTCSSFQSLKNSTGGNANYAVAHCAGNASGLNPCGRTACSASQTGTCQDPQDFEKFLLCIEGTYPSSVVSSVFTTVVPNACGSGTDPRVECTLDNERARAASAIENLAVLEANASDPATFPTLTCGATQCAAPAVADKSCDGATEFNNFKTCMDSSLTTTSCTSGFNCTKRKYGTTRWDAIQATFFDILDADNSLATLTCDDPNMLFDGSSTSIPCSDFMFTPFRDVGKIVQGTGGGSKLPITNLDDIALIDTLDSLDTAAFNIRIRPFTYGGGATNLVLPGDLTGVDSCESNDNFGQPQGGFAGGSFQSFENVWKFFRDRRAGGRSPLANALGFDDDNNANSQIGEDALDSFRVEMQTDPACSCRAEFIIVVTGGLDNCSGDCAGDPFAGRSGLCSVDANGIPKLVTGISNMRSSIQAVSNHRTFYARNPITNNDNCPGPLKKEILTFVIGLGVKDPEAVRTLNSMALGGGTHTTGIIKHFNPEGALVGTIEPTDVIPNAPLISPSLPDNQLFRDFAVALGIDTNPNSSQLEDCLTPSESIPCEFQGTPIFDNIFFTDFSTPAPLDATDVGESFAFFVEDPSELVKALEDIFEFIGEFPTAGVAPSAPTSSASVAVSDRIFIASLTPLTAERIWQGRLALFGFVDEPGNPGSKVIIRKPDPGADLTNATVVDAHAIFNANGALNANARRSFWEAGRLLAERDIVADPRRLFTVDSVDNNGSTAEEELAGMQVGRLRYEGELIDFSLSSTDITPDDFGISDADVTDPIPLFCTAEPPDGINDCNSDSDCSTVTPFSDSCKTCVKNCIRDRIADFMSGNTRIRTVGDPFGVPCEDASCTASMGVNCPIIDPDNPPPPSAFDTCSVRLGDIFHSPPVLVGSPSPLFFDFGFQAFAQQFKDRSAAVYVGANAGLLHAFHGGELELASSANPIENPFTLQDQTVPFFNPGNGVELFGFAPPSFQPDSRSANDPQSPSGITPPDFRFGDFKTFVVEEDDQRSFMDGSPLVADVFIDGYENGISDPLCPDAISSPDGQIDVCGREWHTLLISGYRNGGGAFTAIDVSNVKCAGGVGTDCSTIGKQFSGGPDYPRHLWTLFDKDFGNTWSDVTIGRVRMNTSGAIGTLTADRWVMFVGGGLDPVDTNPTDGVTFGNAFYAIDIATGRIIFKFHPTDPIPSTLSSDADLAEMTCDMVGRIGVFDINADGYMDLAYGGDDCGRLWRFDVSLPIVDNGNDISETGLKGDADITAPDWTGDIAFCATADINQCLDPTTIPVDPITLISQRMPIFFAPTAVLDDLGRKHVIFVTGNRRNPTDTKQFGKLYSFIDTFIPAFLAGGTAVTATTKTEADFDAGQIIDLVPIAGLNDQFTTEGGSTINNQGEFIVRFPNNIDSTVDPNVESPDGEKGFGAPVVIRGVLIFTTFAPDPVIDNPCESGLGEGRVFALDYLTGEQALVRIPGAANLLQGSDEQNADTAGKTVAQGMPTPAQLTFGARGSVILTLAFTGSATAGGANFLVMELPQIPTRTQTLFWEEIL